MMGIGERQSEGMRENESIRRGKEDTIECRGTGKTVCIATGAPIGMDAGRCKIHVQKIRRERYP